MMSSEYPTTVCVCEGEGGVCVYVGLCVRVRVYVC